MGRTRKSRLDLPERMYAQDGRYIYRPKGEKPVELGVDYAEAIAKYGTLRKAELRPAVNMGDWGDEYMIKVARLKAPPTYLDNIREWKNLRPAFSHLLPGEVTQPLMAKYLAARGAITRGNREKALFSHMLSYCVVKGAIPFNPLYGMRRELIGQSEAPRRHNIADRDLEMFIGHATPLVRVYVDIKEQTGMRKGDILTLEVGSLKDDGVHVMPRKGRRRHPRTGQRIGRSRVFPWSDGLRETFDELLALKRERDRRNGKITPWLFTTGKGNCYYNTETAKSDAFRSIWDYCMDKAKATARAAGWELEHFTEHDIRARVGTAAERAGRQGHKLLGNSRAVFEKAYDVGVEVIEPMPRRQK